MSASPCSAATANHGPPTLSVDTAPESRGWVNWRVGRTWAFLPLELLSSTGAGVGGRWWITPGGRQIVWLHLTHLVLTFLPERPGFQPMSHHPNCSGTPESTNFLNAFSFAASAWHGVCQDDGHTSLPLAFVHWTLSRNISKGSRLVSAVKLRATSPRATSAGMLFRGCVFLWDRRPHVSGASGKTKVISNLRTVLLTYSVNLEKQNIFSWYFLPVCIMGITILPIHRTVIDGSTRDCCEHLVRI